jgi:hypothetical protein
MLLLIFAICLLFLYTTFEQKNSINTFFLLTALAIGGYYYYIQREVIMSTVTEKKNFMNMVYEKAANHAHIDNANIFQVYKPPKTYKYIDRNDYIKDTLFTMRPLLTYDAGHYLNLVVLLEYFLKYHFMVIIGRYNAGEYVNILHDIREEILNTIDQFVYNSPDISLIAKERDLKKTLEESRDKLNGITYKYVKMIAARS